MKHCQRHTGLKKAMNKVTLTFDQIANCEKLLLSCQHPLNGKNLLSSFWQVPLCASQKKLEECSPFLCYCCGFTQPLHRSDRNWKIHTFHHWQIAHTHSTATLLLLATTSLSYQILISNQHTRHHRIYCLSFFIFSLLFCRLIIHLLIFEYFWTTRSCAALWAADLVSFSFCYLRGVTTDLHDTGWESDHFSLPTRGHNWRFRCLDKNLDVYSH